MSQSEEQKVTLFQYLAYILGSIAGKLFHNKRILDLEELTSRRLISQTASIFNASENAEFQKIVSKDENIVASFLTSEKYTVGTELKVALSETFDCNSEEEIIKTQWSGIVSRIHLQKKHEKYLINVILNVSIGEE